MNPNLLVTKIIVPSRRSDVLRRPRLLDFVHEYVGRKLLLLSASAGYGKTSLLVDFANDTELPVCWYSLEESDGDPQVFLEYFVAAIQRKFPHFGGHTLALMHSNDSNRSLDAAIGALVNEIHEQIDSFFVIVLDDYHLVESSEAVNQLLDRLLFFLPENAHVILASRTVPQHLTLTRLTARLQVAGLGAGDLRFTGPEIRELIRQNYGVDISAQMAEDLALQSEGWITGIVLTTPTMWQGLMQEWVKGYTPGSQLFEYLAVEVLSQQPPELQQFLLDTSILNQMDVGICNELLSPLDALAMLQLAEKRNLFITRLEDEGYRYHHLFREFLHHRLRQTHPKRFNDLQQRAAALFERRGIMDQAIELWLASGQFSAAARLIEIVAEDYYVRGRWATLNRWLKDLPEDTLCQTPTLLLRSAILNAAMGSIDTARSKFSLATQEFRARNDTLNLARTLIESARYQENLETAIEQCDDALALLPSHEYPVHALAARTVGTLKAQHGDCQGAIPLLERAAKLYEFANLRYEQFDAENQLGTVLFLCGHRSNAMSHFENARTYWQQVGNSAKLANTLNSIAVTWYQQGELEKAHELFIEALAHARRSTTMRTEAYILAGLGDLQRDQEELNEALQSYTHASDIAEKIRENFLITYARVAVGDVWRLAGETQSAEPLISAALQTASTHRSDYEVGLAQMSLGALRLAQNQIESAARHLNLSLDLLNRTEFNREIGRARFYMAQAALQRKRETEAVKHLRLVAAIGKSLDEDQFLFSQAVQAPHLIEFALTRRVGVAYFRRLRQRLEHRRRPVTIDVVNQDAMPQLELHTLGEARVMFNDNMLPRTVWQTATTKELFFFFATNSQGWRKEQVIETLWSNTSRGQGNDLFHASLYRLRRALFPECIVFRNGLYQLNPEAVRWLDVSEFEQELSAAARTRTPESIIEHLERAVALYHGDFLEEFYSDWTMARREQLRERYLQALSQLAHARNASGDLKRAASLHREILRHDPAREETYQDLIELYLASGNRTAALQVYQQCLQTLADELGVTPMPKTVDLYRRLIETD